MHYSLHVAVDVVQIVCVDCTSYDYTGKVTRYCLVEFRLPIAVCEAYSNELKCRIYVGWLKCRSNFKAFVEKSSRRFETM